VGSAKFATVWGIGTPRAKGLFSERVLSEYPVSGPEQKADEPLYGAGRLPSLRINQLPIKAKPRAISRGLSFVGSRTLECPLLA
jgi:hypothetical protein